jgi:hypothetical protein
MKYWQTICPITDAEIRIEWNESDIFNLQTVIAGQWVTYHCQALTYNIETEQEALECALEVVKLEAEKDLEDCALEVVKLEVGNE